MNRTLLVLSLASAVSVACKRDDAAKTTGEVAPSAPSSAIAGKLIPGAATLVGGIDVASVVRSGVYAANKSLIERGDAQQMLDAASACAIGIEKWRGVTFGINPELQAYAAVLTADGIGVDANLSCIHGKIKEKDEGKDPWTVEDRAGKKVLVMRDGTVGYVVDEGSIVVTSKPWADSVKELVDGKGASAFAGVLAPTIARAQTSKTIWLAGTLPAALLVGSPAAGAKDVAGSIDLGSGVALTASVGFADAAQAAEKRVELQAQLDQLKGLAPGLGVPVSLLDSVQLGTSDSVVTVSVTASDSDIQKIRELVMRPSAEAPM